MATYGEWCHDWSLPPDMEDRERARWRTPDSSAQRLVAVVGGEIVGVSVLKQTPVAVLSLLMVDPAVWGTGVARCLHDRTLRDVACSTKAVRLTVPEGNGRARRFYEKNDWQRSAATPSTHPWLDIPMLEYERTVPRAASG
jgi:GNAT superfamily N-acetyltransferase